MYRVTRYFTSGLLHGLEYTEVTSVPYVVGYTCDNPLGGSGYIIVSVESI